MNERSYNRAVWPMEYYSFPTRVEIDKNIQKYGYESHEDMLIMLFIGTANILFYSLFYCDILTLFLPTSIQSLDLLPFLLGLVDFIENSLFFVILIYIPEQIPLWDYIGYVTMTKVALTYLVGKIVMA